MNTTKASVAFGDAMAEVAACGVVTAGKVNAVPELSLATIDGR